LHIMARDGFVTGHNISFFCFSSVTLGLARTVLPAQTTSLRNGVYLTTFYNAQGFKKLGSDNSKILLGGGGEMNVSDFIKINHIFIDLDKATIEDLHNIPFEIPLSQFGLVAGEKVRIIPEKCMFLCDSDGSQFLGTSDIFLRKKTTPLLGL